LITSSSRAGAASTLRNRGDMMKWGETQNLLSVIIGLNIAYYAFRELRSPHLNTVRENLSNLSQKIQSDMDDVLIAIGKIPNGGKIHGALFATWMKVLDLEMKLNLLTNSTAARRIESRLGILSMVAAGIGTGLLIFSTVNFEGLVPQYLFWLIVVLGFLPVAALVGFNYYVLWNAKPLTPEFDQHWRTVHLEIGSALHDSRDVILEALANRKAAEMDKGS